MIQEKDVQIVQDILDTASQLFDTDWRKFASGIVLNDGNARKYQGFFACCVEVPLFEGEESERFCLDPVGMLPDFYVSTNTLDTKFDILTYNQLFLCSMEGRDPLKGRWGGAVRSYVNPRKRYGGTGLPETVDNLTIAGNMFRYKELTQAVYEYVVGWKSPHVQAACLYVGMEQEGYTALRNYIERLTIK